MKYSKTKKLMGTNIEITIISEKNPLEDIFNSFSIFYSLEIEFSRFLPDSSISKLNNDKFLEVSDRFIEILKLTKEIYQKTDGFFNPLISLSNIGYSKSFDEKTFEKTKFLNNLDLNSVSILGNIVSLKEDENLDFGGIVKGYGVDLVKNYLLSKGYKDFLINAGGDIYISGKIDGRNWIIGIDSPFDKENTIGTLELSDISVSTSGNYKRKWELGNEKFHHIINPKTNKNENFFTSITLISDKTYLTDSLATACFNMELNYCLNFLEENNIDGVLITSNNDLITSKGLDKYKFKSIL